MSNGKRVAGRTVGQGLTMERKPKVKSGGWKKPLIVTACVVALIAAAVVVFLKVFVTKPVVSGNTRPSLSGSTTSDATTGSADTSGNTPVAGERKEDYFTFLLIGKDTGGGGNTDTLILVSYDVPNQQIHMMSIPRDTAVNVPWSVKKINSVYMASEESGGGLENLKKQVGYLTGVIPDFYVTVEWEAVGEIVDAVGGVYFDVPRNMNYDDPAQNLHIHQSAGYRLLSGSDAMQVIRYRHDNTNADGSTPGYSNGDLGRAQVQQMFLKAMADRVLQLGNITKIGTFIEIFMDNVETDLELSNLMWFASKALGMDVDTIQTCTMPGESLYFRGGSYVFADPAAILEVVNAQFNPYSEDLTEADLQILVRNADGSVYVTNGTLQDSRWASSYSGGGGKGTSTTISVDLSAGSASSAGSYSPDASSGSNSNSSSNSSSNTASSGSSGSNISSSGGSDGSANTTDPVQTPENKYPDEETDSETLEPVLPEEEITLPDTSTDTSTDTPSTDTPSSSTDTNTDIDAPVEPTVSTDTQDTPDAPENTGNGTDPGTIDTSDTPATSADSSDLPSTTIAPVPDSDASESNTSTEELALPSDEVSSSQ